MKLRALVGAGNAMGKLFDIPNAKTAMKIMKIHRRSSEYLDDYEILRKKKIKEIAPKGGLPELEKDPKKVEKVTTYLNILLDEEIEVTWKPLEESDLRDTKLSARELFQLIDAHILKDDEEVIKAEKAEKGKTTPVKKDK